MVNTLGQDEIIRALLGQRPRISAGLWLLLKDAHLAEDIFQEVMVKALEGRSLFANEAQLMAWVRITGRNLALNLLKKRSRESCLLDVELWEKVESGQRQLFPGGDVNYFSPLSRTHCLPSECSVQ